MKNVAEIISHMSNTPILSKLKRGRSFKTFISILPKRFQEHILFTYERNSVLFLALDHQGILMELNYNSSLIKDLLIMAKSHDESLKSVNEVRWFVSNKIYKKDTSDSSTTPRYTEKSDATFEVKSSDADFLEKIEKIKEAIKRNIEFENE